MLGHDSGPGPSRGLGNGCLDWGVAWASRSGWRHPNQANGKRCATDRTGHEERSINTRSQFVQRVSCRGVKERQINAGKAYLRRLAIRPRRPVSDASQVAGIGHAQRTPWFYCDGESTPGAGGVSCIIPASTRGHSKGSARSFRFHRRWSPTWQLADRNRLPDRLFDGCPKHGTTKYLKAPQRRYLLNTIGREAEDTKASLGKKGGAQGRSARLPAGARTYRPR